MNQELKPATSKEDQIAQQCRAEYLAGLQFRHDREKAWHLIEDFYFNRVKRSLKGKFNAPVPIIPGFVDTWKSKMAKHTTLTFTQQEEADYIPAKKVTALYAAQKAHDDYDWDLVDSDGKTLAALTGRSINRYFASSDGGYKSVLEPVDHYDFIADPIGGAHLERHRFVQQDNIFKSKAELLQGVEAGIYDSAQVTKIINATQGDKLVDNDNMYKSKLNRLADLNLNGISYNYAGQELYKFVEAGTTWSDGKRQYCFFNYETGIWIRCKPLKEVFKSELWWFTSWATHPDPFNFWSKGPCDDMIPLAEVIRVLVNQELDNRNKRNYGMRGYDPKWIPDPSQLEWKADGLFAFKSDSVTAIGDLNKAIVNFETPEVQGTIDLVNWIDGMLKEKTGINSEAQGQADGSKVGIAYLNVQQTAERTILIYESYSKSWQAIGRRFLWGLYEHMRTPMAVKIIGENGAMWDEIARREIDTDWDIRVEGGQDDAAQTAMNKKQLSDILGTFQPDELAVTSPKWRAKIKLQAVITDDDEIRMAFDLEGDQNKEVLAQASQMIQDCLEGKPYRPYRGATTVFVQKIVDYATDTPDLALKEFMKLMKIAQAHMPIAQKNAIRKATQIRAQQGMPSLPGAGQPPKPNYGQLLNGGQGAPQGAPPQGTPAPGTPQDTASQSQQLTQLAPQPAQVGQPQ